MSDEEIAQWAYNFYFDVRSGAITSSGALLEVEAFTQRLRGSDGTKKNNRPGNGEENSLGPQSDEPSVEPNEYS